MLPNNSYAILKEDFPICCNKTGEDKVIPKGSPILIRDYNELIPGYLGVFKLQGEISEVYGFWDIDLEPVEVDGLEQDVRQIFGELSQHPSKVEGIN